MKAMIVTIQAVLVMETFRRSGWTIPTLVRWYAAVSRTKDMFTCIHPETCHAVGSRCSDRPGNVLWKDRCAVSSFQVPLLSTLAKKANFLQMLVSYLSKACVSYIYALQACSVGMLQDITGQESSCMLLKCLVIVFSNGFPA